MNASLARVRWLQTPEGIAIPFEVAGAGDRIVAFAIDFALIAIICIAFWILALLTFLLHTGSVGFAAAILANFLVRNFYFVFLELMWGGATVGKRVARIRVIARDGGTLSASSVFARNLTRDLELFLPLTAMLMPSALVGTAPAWGELLAIVWLFVFVFIPLLNRDRLRVGDLIAGTIVVRSPRERLLPDLASAAAATAPAMPGRPAVAAPRSDLGFTREQLDLYGIKELQVLEDLLRRHGEGTVPLDTLVLVASKIQRKIGWTGRAPDVATFLRSFYAAQRGRLEEKLLFGKRQEEKKK